MSGIQQQIADLAKEHSDKILTDVKEFLTDDATSQIRDLSEYAFALKAKALLEQDDEQRALLEEDLEFVYARIKTQIETKRLVAEAAFAAKVMEVIKTTAGVFATGAKVAISSAASGLVGNALPGIDNALDKLGSSARDLIG